MKIEGGRGVQPGAGTRKAGGAAEPGFAPAPAEPAPARAASGVVPTPAIDALLALQGEGFEPHQRARRMRRAGKALDALALLEQGLVEGRAPASLKTEIEGLIGLTGDTGEAGLDDLMREIDTRLAVEAAKLERVIP